MRIGSSMNGKTDMANLGPNETRKRLFMGIAMVGLGITAAVILAYAQVRRGWYAALFVPFWMGTLGISQARKKT